MATGYRVCCCALAGTEACYRCSNNGYWSIYPPVQPVYYPTPSIYPPDLEDIIKKAVEDALRERDERVCDPDGE